MSKEVLEESLLLTRSGAGRRPTRHRVGGQQKGAFIIELSTASCWYRLKTKQQIVKGKIEVRRTIFYKGL